MRRTRTVRHFKILDHLDPVHHEALEALVLGRDRNMKAVVKWLAALGCRVSFGTVCRYRHHVLAQHRRRLADRADAEREAAENVGYAIIARHASLPDFTVASIVLCRFLMNETLMLLRGTTLRSEQVRAYLDALSALHRVGRRARFRPANPPSLN